MKVPEHQSYTIRVLGEAIDLRANAVRAWQLHRPFIWLLLATALLDAISTIAFMSTLGPEQEQNPFIRWLAQGCGPVAGTALGKLAQVLAVAGLITLAPRLARLVFTVAITLNLAAWVVNARVFIFSL